MVGTKEHGFYSHSEKEEPIYSSAKICGWVTPYAHLKHLILLVSSKKMTVLEEKSIPGVELLYETNGDTRPLA